MTLFDTPHHFLLMFHVRSNYGSMSCLFWDIQCRKYPDLQIPVKGT